MKLTPQHDQWIVGIRIPAIRQLAHVLSSRAKISSCPVQEGSRDHASRLEAKRIKSIPRKHEIDYEPMIGHAEVGWILLSIFLIGLPGP